MTSEVDHDLYSYKVLGCKINCNGSSVPLMLDGTIAQEARIVDTDAFKILVPRFWSSPYVYNLYDWNFFAIDSYGQKMYSDILIGDKDYFLHYIWAGHRYLFGAGDPDDLKKRVSDLSDRRICNYSFKNIEPASIAGFHSYYTPQAAQYFHHIENKTVIAKVQNKGHVVYGEQGLISEYVQIVGLYADYRVDRVALADDLHYPIVESIEKEIDSFDGPQNYYEVIKEQYGKSTARQRIKQRAHFGVWPRRFTRNY